MSDTSLTARGDMLKSSVLAGQHAIVTGGSSGIGAATSEYLAAMGANVSILALPDDLLPRQEEKLKSNFNVRIFARGVDMRDPNSVEKAFAAAAGELGAAQIMVNCAGIGKSAPFLKTDLAFWKLTIDLNLTGTYLAAMQVFDAMKKAGYGRIVNIASTVGLEGAPYITAYTASKHGVVGFTRALALEAAKTGVTVNSVCPGYTDTNLVAEAVGNIVAKTGQTAEEARAALANMAPIGRLIRPSEVAETVAWLCLPSSAAITGQAIVVAGGAVTN